MEETFEEFSNKVLKRSAKRQSKIKGCIGVYDIYKHIRKNKWYDIGRPLSEHEFYSIVRGIDNLLAEELSKGNTVTFPYRMGSLELRKSKRGASIKNGKLNITYPINWNATLKLWYKDKEAMQNKVLIRDENNTVYHIRYNKYKAVYNNKVYYQFAVNRAIKQKFKEHIKEGTVDAMFDEF